MKNPDGSITEERLVERDRLTPEQQAVRIVFERFRGIRPDESEIANLAGAEEIKMHVRALFAEIDDQESTAPEGGNADPEDRESEISQPDHLTMVRAIVRLVKWLGDDSVQHEFSQALEVARGDDCDGWNAVYVDEFVKDGVGSLTEEEIRAVVNGDYNWVWEMVNKFLEERWISPMKPIPID